MSQARAQEIFELARTVRQSGPDREALIGVIDQAIASLENRNVAEALSSLKIIRPALNDTLSQADGYPEMIMRHYVDTMVQKTTILELHLELARLKCDRELVEACEFSLKEMDSFFAAAISYLEPDSP